MTSQVMLRLDGYPDEVVLPALSVEAEVEVASVTADVEVQRIPE